MGAAFYAGIKPKKAPKTENKTPIGEPLKIKLAYDRVVQSEQTLLICKSAEPANSYQYRVVRKDGGFDSGLISLEETNKCYLPVVSNTHNSFEFMVMNMQGDRVYAEEVGISHGKFSIDGQPLPENICLEVDAVDENTTFLEPIFKKNSILPLKKTILKQVSKTIPRSSDDKILIKVVEGRLDTLPSANKLIGLIEISGNMLERDLIKGSDIELTFEITESRDIKVSAFLTLTDQNFEDTFSPSEFHVSQNNLLKETKFFQSNLLSKQKEFENTANYEKAAAVNHLLKEVIDLEDEINMLADDDVSDSKYKLEIRKRSLAHKIHKFYNSNYLTKIIERYYKEKENVKNMLLDKHANEADRTEFHNLIATENSFLNEGNISVIKMKIDHLKSITTKIYNRDTTPPTPEGIQMTYLFLKHRKYQEEEKAQKLIEEGDLELSRKNYAAVYSIALQLHYLKENEANNNSDIFRNDGTGLK